MRFLIGIAVVVVLATPAHADKLADARQAIDEVRYDDARRLLVEAIDAGRNQPEQMRQLYELSASTAIVLGQAELGEQYYRRWLAIDPSAKLPAGSAPKLVEAFVAAQAWMTAHGRLVVTAQRLGGQADVVVTSDPLGMAVYAYTDANPEAPVPISNGRAHVYLVDDRAHPPDTVQILDDHRNTLLVIELPPEVVLQRPVGVERPRAAPRPGLWGRWTTWAVPSGACLVAGAVLGTLAITQQDALDRKLADSGNHTFAEIQHDHDLIKREGTIAIGLAAGAVVFAIPTVVLYLRQQDPSRLGPAPIQIGLTGATSVGVSGRF